MPSKHRFDNHQVSFGTVIPTSDSPTASAQTHDIRINTDSASPISMWKCTAGGTPGTWVALTSGAGSNGTNGTNGINAFTTVTTSFAQPASAATVSVTFGTTAWMAQNQIIYIATGGYYLVTSITNSTVAVIQNLGYAGNAVVSTTIVSTSRVSPGGVRGLDGANGTNGSAGTPGSIIATLCGGGMVTDLGSLTQPIWLGNGTDDYFSSPYAELPTQDIYALGARNVSAQVKMSVLGVASGGVIFGLTREGSEIADTGSIATPGAAPYSIGPASMGAFNYFSYGIRVRVGTGYTSSYPATTPLVYRYTLTFT